MYIILILVTSDRNLGGFSPKAFFSDTIGVGDTEVDISYRWGYPSLFPLLHPYLGRYSLRKLSIMITIPSLSL